MNVRELLLAMDQVSREKGISREKLMDALENALEVAARKKWADETILVQLDRESGEINVFSIRVVVEEVADPKKEILLEEARGFNEDAEIGDEIGAVIEISEFGRIAAQIVKQVVLQRVKEAENEIVLKEYGDRIGDIVNGVVVGQERRHYIIDLGKAEAILPMSEQVRKEKYHSGDRIRAYLVDVRLGSKGPEIILSRAHKNFVRKLFEIEVPEISEGIVEIKGVERNPGERAKISVLSKDEAVDPVGACVGMKGVRVQSVVRELRGEKIDIISWSEDPRVYIAEALSPAVIEKVGLNQEAEIAVVVVSPGQLSLAIGRKGQNVRLASKLTGWKIDVMKDSEYDLEIQNRADAINGISENSMRDERLLDERLNEDINSVPWIDSDVAELLKENGVHTIEDVATCDLSKFLNDPQLGEKVQEVVMFAKDIKSKRGSSS